MEHGLQHCQLALLLDACGTGGGGAPSGRFRTLNGELTKRQMAEGAVLFETRRYQAGCRLDGGTTASGDKRPVCTTVPLFPLAQDKVRIACIGPEADDCPMTVEVDLKAEQLIAGLRGARQANGAYGYVQLEWCGTYSNANGLAVGWTPLGQYCTLSGTSRPINGEFTKRQLADANIGFSTRRIEALCRLDGSAVAGVTKPVCEKVLRSVGHTRRQASRVSAALDLDGLPHTGQAWQEAADCCGSSSPTAQKS